MNKIKTRQQANKNVTHTFSEHFNLKPFILKLFSIPGIWLSATGAPDALRSILDFFSLVTTCFLPVGRDVLSTVDTISSMSSSSVSQVVGIVYCAVFRTPSARTLKQTFQTSQLAKSCFQTFGTRPGMARSIQVRSLCIIGKLHSSEI